MSSKRKQNILFLWDKLKTVPSNGKYWVLMGLILTSVFLFYFNFDFFGYIMVIIFSFELLKYFYYEVSSQDKLDDKDMRRAEKLYDLMNEDDDE